MKKAITPAVLFPLFLILCAAPLFAQTSYTWSKGANGNWNESSAWTPNGVPGTDPADSATIDTGYQVTLGTSTTVASMTVKNTNASLLLSGNIILTATSDVNVLNSGAIFFQPASASANTFVQILAANMTVDATSKLDGNGRGYAAQYGPASASDLTATINTSTNFAGKDFAAAYQGGGGGGDVSAGGNGFGPIAGGLSYGDFTLLSMGAGGGRGQGAAGVYHAGGAGGGALKLDVAGTLTLNGNITANGTNGSTSTGYGGGGGGAGGGLQVNAGTLSGTGNITANGGNGGNPSYYGGGGGSGGRISLTFDNGTNTLASVTATRGALGGTQQSYKGTDGGAGSVWIQDRKSTTSDETDDEIKVGGNVTVSGNKTYSQVTVVAVTGTGSVTFANNLTVATAVVPSATTMTVTGTLTVNTTFTLNGTAVVNGVFTYGGATLNLPSGSVLQLNASPGTLSDVTVNGGVLDLRNNITVTVTANMSVTNSGTVYFQPTGTTSNTVVRLVVNGNLNVDTTSKISGDGRGYPGQYGPASATDFTATINTTTNFAGKDYNAAYRGGGGGGQASVGGDGFGPIAGGLSYGDSFNPLTNGAGGGRGQGAGGVYHAGGPGGGALKLEVAGTLTLNGLLTANGTNGSTSTGYGGGGGGAGGSLNLTIGSLAGTGNVTANGGAGGNPTYYGGGGGSGGRISLTFDNGSNTLAGVNANGGLKGGTQQGYKGNDGGAGSVWIQDRKGTVGDETDDEIKVGGNVTVSGNKTYAQVTVASVTGASGSVIFTNNLTVGIAVIPAGTTLTVTGNLTVNTTFTLSGTSVVTGIFTYSGAELTLPTGSLLTLNSSPGTFGGITVNGGILDLRNNITVTVSQNMSVTNSGTVYFQPAGTTSNTVVRLIVNGNLNVDTTSKISGDGRGYAAQYGPASASNFTATINTSTNYAGKDYNAAYRGGGGGGDASAGGNGFGSIAGGLSYGDGFTLLTMGAGGGRGLSGITHAGGPGGGALKLEVGGTLTLNGLLTANGTNGISNDAYGGGGGGAGGSIFITTGTLTGTGNVTANGGNGGNPTQNGGGGGSGGRISLTFDSGSNALASVNANGGAKGGIQQGYQGTAGGAGSVWIQDRKSTAGDETDDEIKVGGNVTVSGNKTYSQITVASVTGTGSVTFTNNLTVATAVVQSSAALTMSGNLTVNTAFTLSGTVTMNGMLNYGGTVTVPTGAVLRLNTSPGTWGGLAVSGGTLDLRNNITVTVNGNMSVTNSGVVYFQPLSAASSTYVRLVVTGYLNVDSTARIDGNGRGYSGQYGPASSSDLTATINTATNYAGKDYNTAYRGGGGGGQASAGGTGFGPIAGGLPFGDAFAPLTMGSGGGRGLSGVTHAGGAGGGALKLEVGGTLTLNGLLTANGTNGISNDAYGGGGGGAGGSLFIITGTLTGTGNVTANGGNGGNPTQNGGGGGSGGRISMTFDNGSNALASVNANGGALGGTQQGYKGTAGGAGSIWIQNRKGTPGDATDDDITAGGNLTVTGDKTYASLTVKSVTGIGSVTFANNLTVTTLTTNTSAQFAINGNLTATNVTNNGSTTVQGSATLSGILSNTSGMVFVGFLNYPGSLSLSTGSSLTLLSTPQTAFQNITLDNNAVINLRGLTTMTVQDVTLSGTSRINVLADDTHPNNFIQMNFANLVINAGAQINADGNNADGGGYDPSWGPFDPENNRTPNDTTDNLTATPTANTPYAGKDAVQSSGGGGGGSHGGHGGTGANGILGGEPYGYAQAPITKGSGGGYGRVSASLIAEGGKGGGVILLVIDQTLVANGTAFSAKGENGKVNTGSGDCTTWGAGGGGGGGGSVWITTESVSGNFTIDVRGGDGGCPNTATRFPGGGGGGGRAAFYVLCGNPDVTIRKEGGDGCDPAQDGQPGTEFKIISCDNPPPVDGPLDHPKTFFGPEFKGGVPEDETIFFRPDPKYAFTEELKLFPGGILPLMGCAVGNSNPWVSIGFGLTYMIGEPVLSHTGEFQRNETDLSIPGRGLSFQFVRTYRSRIDYLGPVGNNWDHNYNIRITPVDSSTVALQNGFARTEIYTDYNAGTGEYTTPAGYYNKLKKNTDGTYTMTERNGTESTFGAEGRITRVKDRNNNAMIFEYDSVGRLIVIKDTLYVDTATPQRKVQFFYVTNTFLIERILDWKNREIVYSYYGDNEPGGHLYDLKSVSYPPTPDQSNGTTISYTYTKYFLNETLNHNLLTIKNPNEQPSGPNVLTNTFDSNDRVISQVYGGGTYTFAYGTNVTTETDRNGNVRKVYFNQDATTDTYDDVLTWKVEQYTRGVRSGDPSVFTTLFDHNTQGNLTKVTFPKGNTLTMTYDESNSDPLQRGNVLEIRRKDESLGSDPDIVTTFTYYPSSQFSLVQTMTDPKGNTTNFTYDTSGNLTQLVAPSPTTYDTNGSSTGSQSVQSTFTYNSFGQVLTSTNPIGKTSTFTYYASGNPSYGYLQQVVVDSSGTNLTASFAYDTVGNLTSVTDGRSNVTTFEYNNRDQLTKTTSASPFAYIKEYHYDANGNGVQTDIANVNAANISGKTISAENQNATDSGNPTITHTNNYDILDRLTASVREISGTETTASSYTYDSNDNLTFITQPEGNQIKLEYDERNLLYTATRGFGSSGASMSSTNYDPNGNVTQQVDGRGHLTQTFYDGFDRPKQVVDHQGNYTNLSVDANSNVTKIENYDFTNLKLTSKELFYDELDRNYRSLRHFLNGSGGSTGTVKMAYFFDQNSRIVRAEDDNNHGADYVYDGANRMTTSTDALGNVQSYSYDGNSNLTQSLATERDPETSATQQFVTEYAFDAINRVKQSIYRSSDSSIVITNKFNHDSRNNTTFTLDAENNTITHEFDAINRMKRTLRDLRTSGTVTATVVTTATYDKNSRLTASTDGNSNSTSYTYDALDRQTVMTYPDSKTVTYAYDLDDNLVQTVDPNGTVVALAYDSLERLTGKTVTRASGVLGTTYETYSYDGLSRLVSAADDDSTVNMVYDSLSRVTSTTQNGKTISRLFDGTGNRLQINYPGGKTVSYYPDELDRISKIRAGAYSTSSSDPIISSYKYVGYGRVKERSYLNSTKLAVTYDGVKRITDYTNSIGANTISQYQYAYDNMFNKLFEKRVHQSKRDDYTYDSLYRMVEQKKDAALDGSSPVKTISYVLDDSGNRTQVSVNGTSTNYTVNNLNQYTYVGTATQTHDFNGNLTDDTTRAFSYDYANRLVEIVFGSVTVEYKYDVFGRRIEKSVGSTITRYYFEGARTIEDRTGGDAVDATYVYGNGIDEILTMEKSGNTYYFHSNSLGSVTEITNSSGDIVERYEYDVYGAVTIFTGPGTDGFWHTSDDVAASTSAIGNRYMYTAREYEPEVGLYYYRARFYDPLTGRFLQRDPIGPDGLGSLYAYVSNSPAVYVDPMGLSDVVLYDDAGAGVTGNLNDIAKNVLEKHKGLVIVTRDKKTYWAVAILEKFILSVPQQASARVYVIYDFYEYDLSTEQVGARVEPLVALGSEFQITQRLDAGMFLFTKQALELGEHLDKYIKKPEKLKEILDEINGRLILTIPDSQKELFGGSLLEYVPIPSGGLEPLDKLDYGIYRTLSDMSVKAAQKVSAMSEKFEKGIPFPHDLYVELEQVLIKYVPYYKKYEIRNNP